MENSQGVIYFLVAFGSSVVTSLDLRAEDAESIPGQS